jgi:hypothetical protein
VSGMKIERTADRITSTDKIVLRCVAVNGCSAKMNDHERASQHKCANASHARQLRSNLSLTSQ